MSEACEQRFAIVVSLGLALLMYHVSVVFPPAEAPPPHPVMATVAATASAAAVATRALRRRRGGRGGWSPGGTETSVGLDPVERHWSSSTRRCVASEYAPAHRAPRTDGDAR